MDNVERIGDDGDAMTADLVRRARVLLQRDMLPDEALSWARMTTANREEALRRIDILRRWEDPNDPLKTADAAREFKRTIDQFYRITAQWRKAQSILSVGASAARSANRGARLDPDIINRLQAVVASAVRDNGEISVSALCRLVAERSGVASGDLPSASTIRTIVDREILRAAAQRELGRRLRFDVTAIDVEKPSGGQYLLFGLLDVGSAMILGHSFGSLDASLAAYRRAATVARSSLSLSPLAGMRWSEDTARVDMVCGMDVDECKAFLSSYPTGRDRAQMQPAFAEKRFGRHFRRIVGPRLGRIGLKSTKPVSDGEESMLVLEPEEAGRYVAVEIAEYNASRARAYGTKRRRAPAEETVRVLDHFVSGSIT